MLEATKAAIKEKKSEFDKFLAIANPKHGPNFLAEVDSNAILVVIMVFGIASYLLLLSYSI